MNPSRVFDDFDLPGVAKWGFPAGFGIIDRITNVTLCDALRETCDICGFFYDEARRLRLLAFPLNGRTNRSQEFANRLAVTLGSDSALKRTEIALAVLTRVPVAGWLQSTRLKLELLDAAEGKQLREQGAIFPAYLNETIDRVDLWIVRDQTVLRTLPGCRRYDPFTGRFAPDEV